VPRSAPEWEKINMAIFVQACFPYMTIFPGAGIGAMDFVQACFP
jgi:hypothetical protein